MQDRKLTVNIESFLGRLSCLGLPSKGSDLQRCDQLTMALVSIQQGTILKWKISILNDKGAALKKN